MNEPIEKYFRLGTIHWMSYPPERVDSIASLRAIAADPRYGAVEVTHFASDSARAEAKSIIAQSGLAAGFGAQPMLLGPGLNPNDTDEQGRVRARDTLLAAVDEAKYLGADKMAFLAGRWTPDTREDCFRALVRTTREVCGYAASRGIKIELEVFDYDVDKRALIGPAELAAAFAREVRQTNPDFGLIADLSHFPLTRETSAHAVGVMREFITHFHVGNAVAAPGLDAYGDQHPRFGYPGGTNGVTELADFFRALRAEGFFRADAPMVLSYEVKPRPEEIPEIIAANTLRAIYRAWAEA